MIRQLEEGLFDVVQPDATVIGGIRSVLDVFDAARRRGTEVVVHSWGGPVSVLANYHAAFAGGGRVAEWPMKDFPIREAMYIVSPEVDDGRLCLPNVPGLGVELTPEIEKRFPFREDAVYSCLGNPDVDIDDTVWAGGS
jgi:L-alanine-DL-glutamate epimerase-like enolase superfamily enzyme